MSSHPAVKQSALVAIAALTLSLGATLADTITLKGGLKMEGKLVSESAEEVRFEVGKSVKEVRTFKRSEVEALDVVSADEVAFLPIKKLLPTPNLLGPAEYAEMIDGAPSRFLTAFPKSRLKPEVAKIIAALEAERAQAEAGAIKIDGQWVTAEQIAADPYNHAARIALAKLKERIAADELLASLRDFDALEQAFPESTSYPQAIDEIRKVLPKQNSRLASLLATATLENEQRKKDYEAMGIEERANAEAAYDRELASFLKRHSAEKAAKKRWLDYHSWDSDSIKDAQEEVKNELLRLERIDTKQLATSADYLHTVAIQLSQNNFLSASEQIAKFGAAKPNSFAATLKDAIAQGLQDRQLETANSDPAPESGPQIPTTTPDIAERPKETAPPTSSPEPAPAVSIPAPDPGSEPTSADSSSDADEDYFDEDEEDGARPDEQKAAGGIKLTTILMIIIPIMIAVTIASIVVSKKNKIDDFEPLEKE